MDAGIYCACRAIHPEWEWGSKIFEVYEYGWDWKYSVYYLDDISVIKISFYYLDLID